MAVLSLLFFSSCNSSDGRLLAVDYVSIGGARGSYVGIADNLQTTDPWSSPGAEASFDVLTFLNSADVDAYDFSLEWDEVDAVTPLAAARRGRRLDKIAQTSEIEFRSRLRDMKIDEAQRQRRDVFNIINNNMDSPEN